jgi:hypothetical protein
MKEDSSVCKKIVLPLALLVATLALTTAPAAGAHDHDSHASNAQKGQRAEPRARRRSAKRRQKVQKQQAMYTCPMHNEVRSKTPGECPKCKMELDLEETTARAKSE